MCNGVDRRFQIGTTQRLSQITTVGSAVVVDYGWSDRGEPYHQGGERVQSNFLVIKR